MAVDGDTIGRFTVWRYMGQVFTRAIASISLHLEELNSFW